MGAVTFNFIANGFTADDIEYMYKVNGFVWNTDPRTGNPWTDDSVLELDGEVEWVSSISAGNQTSTTFVARAIKFKSGKVFNYAECWTNATTTLTSLRRWQLAAGAEWSTSTSTLITGGGRRGPITIDGMEFDAILVIHQYYTSSDSRPCLKVWCDTVTVPDPEPSKSLVYVVVNGDDVSLNPSVAEFDCTIDWSSRLEPADGYRIVGVSVTLDFTDEYGNANSIAYNSIVDSEFNIKVPANTLPSGSKLTFNVTTEEIPVEPPKTIFAPVWSPEEGDYTVSALTVDVTDGEGVINIYPKTGYKITSVLLEVLYKGMMTGSYISEWVRNNGNGSYSLVIPQGYGGTDYKVYVWTEALPVEDRTIAQTLLHCSSNIEVSSVPHGSSVPFTYGIVLMVQSEAGYHFENKTDLSVVIGGVEYNADETPSGNVVTLTCSTVDWTAITDDVIITATAYNDLPVPDPEGLSLGFVNVYNPTADEMKEAGSKQYISSSGTVNMAEYILKAFKIYARPKVTDAKHEIMWGTYHTTVNSYVVTEAYVDLDCGSVVIPELYGNCLDYQPAVEVELYLPFIGVVTVKPSDFVNKNATLTYRVDVLTGNCLASLASNGIVVDVWTGNMAEDIPLTVSRVNTVNTQLGVQAVQMMGRTPYFIIKRSKPLMPDGSSRLDLEAEFWSILGNLSGYTECLYVSVEGMTATSVEKAEIERLLKAGVII